MRDQVINQGRAFYSQETLNTLIPASFFSKHHKNYKEQTVGTLLTTHPNAQESFFLVSSFLISRIQEPLREKTCGYCLIGDTNWTYEPLVISYHPLYETLVLCAQDRDTNGLLIVESLQHLPIEWKIYDDLTRVELFVPGIKI
jgi:hypothetical protein